MNYPSIRVMGYNVYNERLDQLQLVGDKTIISTINAYSYVLARKDKLFQEALRSSDLIIADGFPIVIASRILNKQSINKIAGYDIFRYILNVLNKSSGSCFFLGSTEGTLKKILTRLSEEYPNTDAGCFSPPFKDNFSDEDNDTMIRKINEFKPEVLFVGMTAPKQECWVFNNHTAINTRIICSIGAVFDFYAKTIRRPAKFWILLKLEWFIRFIMEPKRLWRRYFIYSPRFFLYLLLYKLKFIKEE